MFHYTDFAALKAIIETRSLLATRIDYLNDSSELQIASSFVRRMITRVIGDMDAGPHTPEVMHRIAELRIGSLRIQKLSGAESPNIFIASFSALADDLSQWRGYTTPGCGVRLGFAPTLTEVSRLQGFERADCGYTWPDVGSGAPGTSELFRLVRTGVTDERLLSVALASVKHWTFQTEKEIRLVYVDDGRLPITSVASAPGVPRVRMDLSSSASLHIEEILACPSPDPGFHADDVKEFLTAHGIPLAGETYGIPGVRVGVSRIPYRSHPVTAR
jgi:hypothetical protein